MRRLLGLAWALVACASGAGPLPAYYGAATGNAEHPRYPHARFITGVGVSSASADDAEVRAKENVALQISTRLESETSSFQQYTTSSGATESVTSRVSVRSSFERADLIRVVDHAQQGGVFYAFAALDRAAADRELASAMNADLVSFRAAAEAARTAREQLNNGAFLGAASEAVRLRPRLDSALIVRRAVAGHPATEEADYVVLRNQLLALVEEARAHRVVGVVLKAPGNGQLGELTVNALKRIGVRPDVAACVAREKKDLPDAMELEVTPEERCMEGSLGERCEVVVRMTALACAGGSAGAGAVALVRGVHPSDREKARKSAWDKVTAQAVEAAVRDALKGTLAGE
jgi:hypothetical protein